MGDLVFSTHRSLHEHSNHFSFRCEHCGREYSTVHHLDVHQRSTCFSAKRNIADLLLVTKAHWEERKRRRTGEGKAHPACDLGLATDDLLRSVPSDSASQSNEAVADVLPASHRQNDRESGLGALPDVEVSQLDALPDDIHAPVAQRKPRRTKRLPARYATETEHQDNGEEGASLSASGTMVHPAPSVLLPVALLESLKEVRIPTVRETGRSSFKVAKRYTLYNESASIPYPGVPLATPIVVRQDVPLPQPGPSSKPEQVDDPSLSQPGTSGKQTKGSQSFGPFGNKSGFLLAEWYWNSANKSFADFQKLISIFQDPEFSITDSIKLNWKSAFKALGANRDDLREEDAHWIKDDGWKSTEIFIDVPFHSQTKDPGTKPYAVGTFRHRSLVSIIREKLSSKDHAQKFHYHPFEETWKPTDSSPEFKLYGEMYTSSAFREADDDIQRQPSTPQNKGLERVVVAMMIWSDSTQLTSFGGASLWPCYLFFGNESKYDRAQPSERLGHHVAYFIKLPDHLDDHLKERNGGKLPTDALFAYCARQLFHKQWSVLLDSEFSRAVKDGIIHLCPDGKRRCFYPRILTYSADYPEKVLVAGLRNNGGHPCHRCMIGKDEIYKLGSPSDTTRNTALRRTFEQSLKAFSLVPIESAFETSLALDITPALVVDVLHEFEIGVWKRLYIHMMRLLHVFSSEEGVTLSAELDSRYRAMPAFGRDKIRKFPLNASQMKRKAARDFENLLQCAIPAFDSLIPEPHNSILMPLLYLCAQWHALAKLRLHSDLTISLLEYSTARLGAQMRLFDRTTCSPTPTKELEKEAEARARRDMGKGKGKGSAARRQAQLGIYTIKFHFLGDYASVIRDFGTTDSFSTQTVSALGELYHRVPKSWYVRTDRKDYKSQLSQTERRHARLSYIRAGLGAAPPENLAQQSGSSTLTSSGTQQEGANGHNQQKCAAPPPNSRPHQEGQVSPIARPGYSIGTNQNSPLRLDCFKERVSVLQRHLLPRIIEKMGYTLDDVGWNAWQHVVLHESRLYSHKLLRTTYTTYDMRQDEDIVHIDTPQCNVMLLNRSYNDAEACSVQSPYLYAKVEGIYHANVSFVGELPGLSHPRCDWHRLDFIHVRWMRFLKSEREFTLDRVEPASGPDAWAFVDPAHILRGVHLVPQFALKEDESERDLECDIPPREEQWKAYYINNMECLSGTRTCSSLISPKACIPVIPPGFDWCLDIKDTVCEDGEGEEVGWVGEDVRRAHGGLEDMDDHEFTVYDENIHPELLPLELTVVEQTVCRTLLDVCVKFVRISVGLGIRHGSAKSDPHSEPVHHVLRTASYSLLRVATARKPREVVGKRSDSEPINIMEIAASILLNHTGTVAWKYREFEVVIYRMASGVKGGTILLGKGIFRQQETHTCTRGSPPSCWLYPAKSMALIPWSDRRCWKRYRMSLNPDHRKEAWIPKEDKKLLEPPTRVATQLSVVGQELGRGVERVQVAITVTQACPREGVPLSVPKADLEPSQSQDSTLSREFEAPPFFVTPKPPVASRFVDATQPTDINLPFALADCLSNNISSFLFECPDQCLDCDTDNIDQHYDSGNDSPISPSAVSLPETDTIFFNDPQWKSPYFSSLLAGTPHYSQSPSPYTTSSVASVSLPLPELSSTASIPFPVSAPIPPASPNLEIQDDLPVRPSIPDFSTASMSPSGGGSLLFSSSDAQAPTKRRRKTVNRPRLDTASGSRRLSSTLKLPEESPKKSIVNLEPFQSQDLTSSREFEAPPFLCAALFQTTSSSLSAALSASLPNRSLPPDSSTQLSQPTSIYHSHSQTASQTTSPLFSSNAPINAFYDVTMSLFTQHGLSQAFSGHQREALYLGMPAFPIPTSSWITFDRLDAFPAPASIPCASYPCSLVGSRDAVVLNRRYEDEDTLANTSTSWEHGRLHSATGKCLSSRILDGHHADLPVQLAEVPPRFGAHSSQEGLRRRVAGPDPTHDHTPALSQPGLKDVFGFWSSSSSLSTSILKASETCFPLAVQGSADCSERLRAQPGDSFAVIVPAFVAEVELGRAHQLASRFRTLEVQETDYSNRSQVPQQSKAYLPFPFKYPIYASPEQRHLVRARNADTNTINLAFPFPPPDRSRPHANSQSTAGSVTLQLDDGGIGPVLLVGVRPVDSESKRRLTPSEMESFRRTHWFRGPCCLCALLDGEGYTEARIGIVEVKTEDKDRNQSILHGEYVAVCAKQRCGYTLCLERFYGLGSLKLRKHRKRASPLPPQELVHVSEINPSFRVGDGLFQVMSNVVVRGRSRLRQVNTDSREEKDKLVKLLSEGMTESRFWATFVQCIDCKSVMLRDGIQAYHKCNPAMRNRQRFWPYPMETGVVGEPTVSERIRRFKFRRSRGDVPETRRLSSLRSSPTPTEIIPNPEEQPLEEKSDDCESDGLTEADAEGSDDWVIPDAASDNELPSSLTMFHQEV
ncbi:hypothetical protein NMY22_g3125 [Coprinellus aureogranulatus]|nr:hypothetical protein NMY22_g3125 [Coprinellus aureogranulatus]